MKRFTVLCCSVIAALLFAVHAAGQSHGNPKHPYTVGLLGSLPNLSSDTRERLTAIPGLPPMLLKPPVGCPFVPRCTYAFDRCQVENPSLIPVGTTHHAACWWDIDRGKPRDV